MKRNTFLSWITSTLFLFSSTNTDSATKGDYGEDTYKILANKNVIRENPESHTMTLRQLIDIFTQRKTRWDNGDPIQVVTYAKGSVPQEVFLREVLGMTIYQFKTHLARNTYAKGSKTPKEVFSEEEMVQALISDRNAIGYMYNYILYHNEKNLVIIRIVD